MNHVINLCYDFFYKALIPEKRKPSPIIPKDFHPERHWDFIINTLREKKILTCETVNIRIVTDHVESDSLKILKLNGSEVNHAVLHDAYREVRHKQFYPEIMFSFKRIYANDHCRLTIFTLIAIKQFRANDAYITETLTIKWMPREVVMMIAQYVWSTRKESWWIKDDFKPLETILR